MKWLKTVTIVLIVFIAGSITVTVVLANKFSINKGSIKGTGFIIQELNGAGNNNFDVDDSGNIYFPIITPIDNGIVVYDNNGDYLYTLPILAGGGIGVKIDENNNILVYNFRKKLITQYNNKGIKINTINDEDYSLRADYTWTANQNFRERNDICYINNNGTITKEEEGEETVVFTIPIWQRWYRAFKLIMILSIIALFLRVAIPLWTKAYKARYG